MDTGLEPPGFSHGEIQSTAGSVKATKANPAIAPARCASWLMPPRGCRDAHALKARYSTADRGAGMGTGIGMMKINDPG